MTVDSQDKSSITDNLHSIQKQIKEAAIRSGRQPDEITLIAVSKTRTIDEVKTAIEAGQLEFGENTVQDARTKIDHMDSRQAIWHFIGHLQANKAKYIPGRFQWLHTLDSIDLARKLESLLVNKGQKLSVLIQVNVARDPAKHGLDPDELPDFLDKLLAEEFLCISLRGLMTIGKQGDNPNEQSQVFDRLRELLEKTRSEFTLPGFTELSMGMSGDFIQAIEAGSTMVRIGSQIFGPRNVQ